MAPGQIFSQILHVEQRLTSCYKKHFFPKSFCAIYLNQSTSKRKHFNQSFKALHYLDIYFSLQNRLKNTKNLNFSELGAFLLIHFRHLGFHIRVVSDGVGVALIIL